MRMSFDIQKEDLAEAIADLDHAEIIGLVLEVLSQCATVELDEELVARMWPTIAACYDEEEEKPTLEDLMRRYPAR